MINAREQLAIIIPAYKDEFLRLTLESLAKQTRLDFNVYIGDDASPHDLKSIISNFQSSLNITYKRFESNVGGSDLVSHWKRCIELSKDEDWIWLFSDDDMMDENCVETFYRHISKNPDCSLVHFDVKVVDFQGNNLELFTNTFKSFPEGLKANQFFRLKISGHIQSYVVEYVFKRELYENKGGFVNFDLAWCSDDATWLSFIGNSGLSTIKDVYVYWRFSGSNISSINRNYTILDRKVNACLSFLSWTEQFFKRNNIDDICSEREKIKWLLENFKSAPINLGYKYKKLKFIREGRAMSWYLWIESLIRIIVGHLRVSINK